jgi:ubiquinone/menaquinone biosynthesis C-methylase UbiE
MNDFEALAEAVPLNGRTVVDIGCGDGGNVRRLRAAGADAIGVDIDVTRANQVDPDGRYLQGGAEALPLEDASVDVAVLFKSLHHVPDPHAAFPELHRVVRDTVFVAEPLPVGDFFELLRPVDDETAVRAKAQEAIAAAQGFEHVRTIEYELGFELNHLDELKARVLAADPTRAERFAQLEGQLREAFTPGDFTIPMRADLLRRV